MEIWKDIIKTIKCYDTIILHRHVLPDGDAIGSQLALKQLINLNWPNKKIYAVGTMVDYLQFLGTMDIITDNEYHNALVIISDTANRPRIDDQSYCLAKTIIKIDHHPNNDAYGDVQWVDTTYPAACEMIAQFIFANNLVLDETIAKCLLSGVVSDTTRFMLRQVSERTFLMTSKLLTYYGKNITNIYDNLDAKSNNEAQFLSYCYANYKLSAKGIINLTITNEYLTQLKISADKAAFHVNIFSNVVGHPIWVVGIEYPDKHIRCELRTSDSSIKVNTIAHQFGGGGHDSAAGCKVFSWLEFQQLVMSIETLL